MILVEDNTIYYTVYAETHEELACMAQQYHCEWKFEGRPANLEIVFKTPHSRLDCVYAIWTGAKIIC